MGKKIMERTNAILLGIGAGVTVISAASVYVHYLLNKGIHRELSHLTASVADLKKDIGELKSLSRRKPISGSSVSDETDIYYDFSDEGGEEEELFDGLNNYLSEDENLRTIDMILETLNNRPEIYHKVYVQISALKEKFFDNVPYLWRLAKTCHACAVIAGEKGDTEKKKELFYEAMQQAAAALALTDDDANVHKWYAISIGSCAEFETVQNRIKFGFAFKEHTQIALRLNPNDESLYHLMGRWCYEVAMLSWIERKVATTIYGQLPSASFMEARSYFKEVENLRLNKSCWKENRLFIAKTYIGESDYSNAILWLDKAAEDVSVERSDALVVDEIEELRKKYSNYRP